MKKTFGGYTNVVLSILLLAGCTAGTIVTDRVTDNETENTVTVENEYVSISLTAEDLDETYDEKIAVLITLQGTDALIKGNGITEENGVLSITSPGTYVLNGTYEGRIVVHSEEKGTVRIILNGVNITSSTGSAIEIQAADKTIITVVKDTENTINDSESYSEEDTATAAIYSKDDLVINGSGSLTINGQYNDGITSKDALYILNTNLSVNALDDGIIGKDLLYIMGSDVTVEAGGDGLKASNEKEENSGNILIDSGTVTINAEDDGIQAVSAVIINDGDIQITAGGGASQMQYDSFGFIPGADKEPFSTMPGNDGFGRPNDRREDGFGQMNEPDENGPGMMKPGEWENEGFGGGVPPQWNEGMEPPEMNEQMMPNQEYTVETDTEKKSKGIKTEKLIEINGGSLIIDSADDAMNSSGDIVFNNGTATIKTSDDGMHADGTLTIDDGRITIEQSYEGLEGYAIYLNGGVIDITSSDDGINAADPNASSDSMMADGSILVINGGEITVDAYGDGIDTNGSGTMNGGTVIVYGPVSDGDSALDHSGEFMINGGTFLAGGSSGMVELPEESSSSYILDIGTNSGVITIKDENGNVITEYRSEKTYSNLIYSSELLKQGSTYSVYEDDTLIDTIEINDKITYINTVGNGGFSPGFQGGRPDGFPGGGEGMPTPPEDGNHA